MALLIFLGDSQVTHDLFGAENALANGWDLNIVEAGNTTPIVNSAKTGGEIVRPSGYSTAFGNDTLTFQLVNYDANANDALMIKIPMNGMILILMALVQMRIRMMIMMVF